MSPVILVTGASRGIGAATARLAAERGFAVCINYRSNESAALALHRQITDLGSHAIVVQADISVEADVIRLFEESDRQLGQLTALVNNAGILERQMSLAEMNVARLERILRTNVLGCLLCAREAVRRMSRSRGGSGGAIVNVSSVAARLGAPGEYVDYAASKGAIDSMTIGLSKEVAAEGIRVNAVRPGFIETDIHASGGDPERVSRMARSLPMQRGGTAAEVAEAILWLLSERTSYVTGTFIDLAGGR